MGMLQEVVPLYNGDSTGQEWDLFSPEPAGNSRAVPVFVLGIDDLGDIKHIVVEGEDPVPCDGVQIHGCQFLLSELSGGQQVCIECDHPDVMIDDGLLQFPYIHRSEVQLFPEPFTQGLCLFTPVPVVVLLV